MRYIVLLMVMAYSSWASGANFSVELEPKEPVAGEIFQMNFTIETTSKSEPYISFDPGKAEVQGRRNIGTSVQTTIINGVVETKRITRYVYDLIVNDPGRLILREIRVEVAGEVLEHDRVETNVLRESKKPQHYFLRAEVSKNQLYLGEGATVHYFLYFRVPVMGTEIRDFPKLNSFIKRFHMPSEQVETVEEEGVLYRRKLIYSARVYPEEIGTLEIDPLKIRLQYSTESSSSSPFSGFSFSSRQSQVRNTQSKPVEIEVLPLPLNDMPKNFTGLVGEHEFSLNIRGERYLVNEPIEVKLEVSGPGALENLSPPVLLDSPDLENFDTESRFEEIDKQRARKTFEYTYLARSAFNLDGRVYKFYYFDPDEKEYKSQDVSIPALRVSGATQQATNRPSPQSALGKQRKEVENMAVNLRLMAPSWEASRISSMSKTPFYYLNILLTIMIMTALLYKTFEYYKEGLERDVFDRLLKEMRQKGMTYAQIFNLFDTYRLEVNANDTKMIDLVDDIDLTDKEKKYFKSLLTQAEKESFKDQKEVLNLKFNKRYFENLVRKFRQVINESHSKS